LLDLIPISHTLTTWRFKAKVQVFLLQPWKTFSADSSCRFRENAHFNSEKWHHRAEG